MNDQNETAQLRYLEETAIRLRQRRPFPQQMGRW